jgi:CRISPR system Cascade subunit CasD
VFTVCTTLAAEVDWHLEALAQALRRPHFVTYLGRKACPASLPFAPRTGSFETIEEALDDYPVVLPFAKRLARRSQGSPMVWWDIDLPTRLEAMGELTRRDVPESRAGQFRFGRRVEHYGRAKPPREGTNVP